MKSKKTSADIQSEIVARLGFLPPFFEPALSNPLILKTLWQQTLDFYLDNPLPALFKEKLATFLSRYGSVPYCFLCHASSMRQEGLNGVQIQALLQRPLFPVDPNLVRRTEGFPQSGSEEEHVVLASAVGIFLKQETSEFQEYLKEILSEEDYQWVILFIAYNQNSLIWAEANPGLSTFRDYRVKTHFLPLLEEAPGLKDIFSTSQHTFFAEKERAKLHELFLQAPVAIAVMEGPSHFFTLANPKYLEITGGKEILGKTFADAFPELKTQYILEILDEVFQTGKPFEEKAKEIRINRNPTHLSLGYFDFVCQPFIGRTGKVEGIVVVVSEVTALIEAQKKAKESSDQLRIITDQLPVFIAYMDIERRYRFVNAAYEKWFERPASEMIGRKREEFAPEETNRISSNYDEMVFSGFPVRYENILRRTSGETVDVDVEYIPDFDPDTGKVKGAIIIGRDITENKEALRDAERARQELYHLFMSAPVGICVFEGPSHRYVLANPTYQAIVFGQARDVIGKSIWSTLVSEANRAYIGLLDQVYQSGRPFSTKESVLRIVKSDGATKEIYINFSLEAKRSTDGQIDGVLAVVQEVSDQVLARKRVEQAVQARDDFLSIASHELKTPLTSLQLQTQMMKRNMLRDEAKAIAPEKIRKLVEQTDRSVQRLTRLVEDMFDIARISTGKLILNRESFDLGELVRDVVDRLAAQIHSAEVKISISSEPAVGTWDRFRLDQVITNLITNSLRYGEGSPIEVKIRQIGVNSILSVQDRGPGIALENQSRIFERFERAHSSSSITGLGLGLYISQEIVERHGGRIRVESEMGMGARFIVELPPH